MTNKIFEGLQVNDKFAPHLLSCGYRLIDTANVYRNERAVGEAIGHGNEALFSDHVLYDLAKKYGKSTIQIILKWHEQEGLVAIPKSTNPVHIKANYSIDDFALTESEINLIRSIDQNKSGYDIPEEIQEKMAFEQYIDFDE